MDLPMPETGAAAPTKLLSPRTTPVPLIFASPHSGTNYPAEFIEASRLGPLALRRSEDSFVDELFGDAPVYGAPLLTATFPRAWCDPNRERWELDPGMFEDPLPDFVNAASPRVGAGLGTVARVVASGEPIYRRKLRFAEAEARVRNCWDPYHAALARLVADALAQFRAVLLVDCHSMPGPFAGPGGADVVLGDVHGTSCAEAVVDLVEKVMNERGYRVRRNDPYAGGYTTRHYSRPDDGVHTLQIEVARSLYMDERLILRRPGFARLHADLNHLLARLAAFAPAMIGAT
jgi:N-formylglutamate amidohydrolase